MFCRYNITCFYTWNLLKNRKTFLYMIIILLFLVFSNVLTHRFFENVCSLVYQARLSRIDFVRSGWAVFTVCSVCSSFSMFRLWQVRLYQVGSVSGIRLTLLKLYSHKQQQISARWSWPTIRWFSSEHTKPVSCWGYELSRLLQKKLWQ